MIVTHQYENVSRRFCVIQKAAFAKFAVYDLNLTLAILQARELLKSDKIFTSDPENVLFKIVQARRLWNFLFYTVSVRH